MAEKSWYKDWFNSPLYHKLYFDRDETEAQAFIKKLVDHLHPPAGSRMLDVACGKGRHSKILASLGYNVTGIDISPGSIEYAKQFEKDNLDFFVHDMRLPFWGNYFDYAFNFFTSFGYFKTRREHDDAVRTIAKSLQPGGLFVIDYLNVHYAEDHLGHNEQKKIGETVYDIHRWDDETHFYKKIIVTDPALEQPAEYTEKVAKFNLGDFTDMLSFQGLQVQEVFGDYQFGNYDIRKTPRLILIAAKAKAGEEDKEKRLYSDGRRTDALT
ncbi:MAG TPA: class I SAM-dependent methyltransferase [Chitinophagaceae bacterium]|jgi:SAM-dependent methyltransferase|nr:class I SAM-dependent methyltransferase [Chitinophagaceae bacterium]